MDDVTKETLRSFVRGIYAVQKLRIQVGNRLSAQFRSKLGLAASDKEEVDEEAHKVLNEIRKSYDLLTNGVAEKLPRMSSFKGDAVISTYAELLLVHHYMSLYEQEKWQTRQLTKLLEGIPIYEEFLSMVTGCGPSMSAIIISEFDIRKCKYVSSMWKYAGLDVAHDQRARSRRQEHLRDVAYVSKDGKEATRKGITYNPFLHDKLLAVLATSFLRTDSEYRRVYDNYKHRLDSHPKWAEKTKAHRHRAALRYMVKMFVADLYAAWKQVEGLPAHEPYAKAKLGLNHGVLGTTEGESHAAC